MRGIKPAGNGGGKRDWAGLASKAAVAVLAIAVVAWIAWTLRGELPGGDPEDSLPPEASQNAAGPSAAPPQASRDIYNRTPVATADPDASGGDGAPKAYRVQTPEGVQPCRIYIPEGLSESAVPGGLRLAPDGMSAGVQGFMPVQFSWTVIEGLDEIVSSGEYSLLSGDGDPYWSEYGYVLEDYYRTPALDGGTVMIAAISFRAVPRDDPDAAARTDYVAVMFPSERGLYFIGTVYGGSMDWLYTAGHPDIASFARSAFPEA